MVDKLTLDEITWRDAKARIINKITHLDFVILCKLHAKYYNHKYKLICKCNKQTIRNWIKEVDNKLIK